VDSAEGADAHLHRHYDDENHPKSRFTPLTGLIPEVLAALVLAGKEHVVERYPVVVLLD